MLDTPKQEVNLKIFYLCVHKKLHDRTNPTRIMDKKDFNDILGRLYHLPKKLWICVMKEMEEMDMIEDLGNRKCNKIKIKPLFIDPEEQANKIYAEMKIF